MIVANVVNCEDDEIGKNAIRMGDDDLVQVMNAAGQIINIQNPVKGNGFVINGLTDEMTCERIDNNTISLEVEDESLPTSLFTGGREETVRAQLVPSNYHDMNVGEMLLRIDGAVSLGTLAEIVRWAKEECEVVSGDDEQDEILRK